MYVGEKVRLRGVKSEDVQLAYEYMNDLDVVPNLNPGIPYPMTLEREKAWFESQKEMKDTYNFSIETLDEGLYIGGCGINEFDWKNGTATVGIYIGHKDYKSKGYGTDAMKVLLNFLFMQTNINRVELFVYSFNERAIKSYRKNGFIEEGRARQRIFRNGRYHDEIMMGILREEYMKSY